jgi:S1-C subfamily serine protease
VAAVNENSAAEEAGIKLGDVITKIGDVEVDNVAELQEIVARNRPGDEVRVTFNRNGKVKEVDAVLRNTSGNTELVARSTSDDFEGASFRDLTNGEKRELEITGGAKITEIGEGKWSQSGIKEGFIITAIDKVSVDTAEDVARILQNKVGGVLIEGIYENGDQALYAMKW